MTALAALKKLDISGLALKENDFPTEIVVVLYEISTG